MKNINAVDQIMQDLIAIGSGNIDIMKFDKKWTLKIINSGEHTNILDNSSSQDMVSRMFKLQVETLKEALISINDQVLTEGEKTTLFTKLNPYITQTIYTLYDAERAKKEKELSDLH